MYKQPMLKKDDQVVMHTCIEAQNPNNYGRIWTCRTDEFTAKSGTQVVFLKGFSGYFSKEFLQKVNLELREDSN
ncbi:hypothetical protein [Brevibacillus laterosporus]|uniref:hypothetical protein n=1 Tax=Brevibacillus laterosporus TaxID=1465 RepID=UPI003D1E44A3